MYLYHGTDTKFDYFELEALKKNRLDFGRGLYLSFSEEHAKSAGKRKASDRCGRHYIQNRQSYLYTVDIKYRELANLLTATSPYDGFLHPMKDILGKTYIFRIRVFGDSKEEIIDWANFILENRSNNHLRKREHFDFIVGPVADHRINSIINEEFVLKPFLDKDDEGIYKLAQEKLLNSKCDFTQLCATTEYAIALINNCLVGEGTPYVI